MNPETGQCTQCGASEAMSAKPAKRRTWAWVLALIIFFVLGFLLGHLFAPKCPKCPAPPTPGNAGLGGTGNGHGTPHGGPGSGTPDKGGGGGGGGGDGRVAGGGGNVDGTTDSGKLAGGNGTGDMEGGGGGGGSGITNGHGREGTGVEMDGPDSAGGGGSGNSKLADGKQNGDDSDAQLAQSGVWKLAAGAPLSENGVGGPDRSGNLGSSKVLSAPDFRYDKTGLPRYPDANTAVYSALSYESEAATDRYGSSSGIVTSSDFDVVVDWYRKNLPAGWTNTTIGDFDQLGALAQQLSPDKILQMASSDGKPAAEAPATAANKRTRISMFAPPAGTKGKLGVMIVEKGEKPVEIFMKTRVEP